MNVKKISLNDIQENLNSNIKLSVIIFLVCIVIGTIVAIINAKQYNPAESMDVSQIEETVDLKALPRNEEYYFNAYFELKQKADYISMYLQYFGQVNLTENSKNRLDDVNQKVKAYSVTELKKVKKAILESPVSIEGQEKETVLFYGEQIKDLEEQIDVVRRYLDELIAGNYTDDYKMTKQNQYRASILEKEDEISKYKKLITKYSKVSNQRLRSNSDNADQLLHEECDNLNAIVEEFNSIMTAISEEENYEIIYNKRLLDDNYERKIGTSEPIDEEILLNNKLNSAIAYAKSIEGLDTSKERFFSTLTFFILFGISISVIIGAVYSRNKSETADEH